jgi:hypothetical protein
MGTLPRAQSGGAKDSRAKGGVTMDTTDFLIGGVFLVLLASGGWLWDRLQGRRLECARRAVLKRWIERAYPDS